MIRSIHKVFLLGSKFVGSEIIGDRPSEVRRFSYLQELYFHQATKTVSVR